MSSEKMMVFVDGENITFRYQNMLNNDFHPQQKVIHIPDVFVWHPQIIRETAGVNIIRATYYTYAVGSDLQIEQHKNKIKSVGYHYRTAANTWSGSGFLFPKVFKKDKKDAKRKGVDISIAVDMLGHVHRNDVDIVYLVSGDGDYKPLIEEVIRNGKKVYLAALSDGLNSKLPNCVDKFFNLDDVYFLPQK